MVVKIAILRFDFADSNAFTKQIVGGLKLEV